VAGGCNAFGAVGVSIGTLTAFVLLLGRFSTPLVNLGDERQTGRPRSLSH
jgi:ATP-binding cassette subfamily B protein